MVRQKFGILAQAALQVGQRSSGTWAPWAGISVSGPAVHTSGTALHLLQEGRHQMLCHGG